MKECTNKYCCSSTSHCRTPHWVNRWQFLTAEYSRLRSLCGSNNPFIFRIGKLPLFAHTGLRLPFGQNIIIEKFGFPCPHFWPWQHSLVTSSATIWARSSSLDWLIPSYTEPNSNSAFSALSTKKFYFDLEILNQKSPTYLTYFASIDVLQPLWRIQSNTTTTNCEEVC